MKIILYVYAVILSITKKRIRGYFYNKTRYINLRFTYLLTYLRECTNFPKQ